MCMSVHQFLCMLVYMCLSLYACGIYICLIRIYMLCDSQYKSFYEHLYQSDGAPSTLALFRSDCCINVTVLPLHLALRDSDIDRLYYSLLPLKPHKLLISQQYSGIMIRLCVISLSSAEHEMIFVAWHR